MVRGISLVIIDAASPYDSRQTIPSLTPHHSLPVYVVLICSERSREEDISAARGVFVAGRHFVRELDVSIISFVVAECAARVAAGGSDRLHLRLLKQDRNFSLTTFLEGNLERQDRRERN